MEVLVPLGCPCPGGSSLPFGIHPGVELEVDFFFKIYLFYLFIFGCIGSSLRCAGFSLRWLLVAEHGLYARRLQQLWLVGPRAQAQ